MKPESHAGKDMTRQGMKKRQKNVVKSSTAKQES